MTNWLAGWTAADELGSSMVCPVVVGHVLVMPDADGVGRISDLTTILATTGGALAIDFGWSRLLKNRVKPTVCFKCRKGFQFGSYFLSLGSWIVRPDVSNQTLTVRLCPAHPPNVS